MCVEILQKMQIKSSKWHWIRPFQQLTQLPIVLMIGHLKPRFTVMKFVLHSSWWLTSKIFTHLQWLKKKIMQSFNDFGRVLKAINPSLFTLFFFTHSLLFAKDILASMCAVEKTHQTYASLTLPHTESNRIDRHAKWSDWISQLIGPLQRIRSILLPNTFAYVILNVYIRSHFFVLFDACIWIGRSWCVVADETERVVTQCPNIIPITGSFDCIYIRWFRIAYNSKCETMRKTFWIF